MKICFVALSLYPCLANDYSGKSIGGAEVQQTMIAHGLVEKGVEVSAITEDSGQKDAVVLDGVTVFKTYRQGAGLPVLRFIYPKIVLIYKALLRANADVYYVRNASFLTALVALFCYRHKKKWLYAGAHDTDFIPGSELISNSRDRFLFRLGLRHAPRVVVQTKVQQELLKTNYAKKSSVLYNFSNKPLDKNVEANKDTILWVSTIRRWKRPELFLQLAIRLPDYNFVMIGGPDGRDTAFFKQIEKQAKTLDNLKFVGFASLDLTESFFDQASVFVNTSIKEGFPNTFLQAWRRGIPTVSFFDPDAVIAENDLGNQVDSLEELVNAIPDVFNRKRLKVDSICSYFKAAHSDQVINNYIDLFDELI